MTDQRPNRYNAARDRTDARLRVRPRPSITMRGTHRPLPLARVLAVIAAIAATVAFLEWLLR